MIQAASCGDREKITSYLDGYLVRQIFHEYRAHTSMKSRQPKERPTELSATIVKPDGSHGFQGGELLLALLPHSQRILAPIVENIPA